MSGNRGFHAASDAYVFARYSSDDTAMRPVKILLAAIAAVASAALLVRVCIGPSRLAASPLNLESIAFLAFSLCCALLSFNRTRAGASLNKQIAVSNALCIAAICCVAVAPYLPAISNPLLFDDYTHLSGSRDGWAAMIARSLIHHPQGGDFFFRPAGYISYWIDYRWAGADPVRWHLWNVSVHAANSVLLYVLCRQLAFGRLGSLISALVFALHAAHAEVVAWMAARFDLLAVFFSLAALIALNHFIDSRKAAWFLLMACACLLAVLSKEAAFCLPLLALCLILFRTQRAPAAIAKLAAVLAVLCGIVFLYREWFLGGIGGYRDAAGAPAILNFSLLRTIKALFYREWAVLFFPLNWSVPPGLWLKLASIAFLLAAVFFLVRLKRVDSRLPACLALVFAASLPVQHLLLIGQDLSGARVLYLPTVGLAMFWGLLAQSYEDKTAAAALTTGLLLFQWTALAHNLGIWRGAAHLSRQTCAQAAEELRQDPRPITVLGLPNTWNGVFFLRNGFPLCVAAASQRPEDTDRIVPADSSARIFAWDAAAQKLIPK
jgi:hypothetical protein